MAILSIPVGPLLMSLMSLFGRAESKDSAEDAYRIVLGRSREPWFYTELEVPDSVDGRFEMLVLHAFLVLHRLKGEPGTSAFGQQLFDVMFDDLDLTLREMGAGDMGVGKRVKAMVQAFYGRVAAYDPAMSGETADGLSEALVRNLYRTGAPAAESVARMAGYVRGQAAHLGGIGIAELMAGNFAFGDLR